MDRPKKGISVDGGCSGNPGRFEYRAVDIATETELFEVGRTKIYEGTNNIAEFLAIVHCLGYCKENNVTTTIYTDSKTAMAWVRNCKANTTYSDDVETTKLLSRAELFLKNNPVTLEILKWKTKIWGEIPADYGRK